MYKSAEQSACNKLSLSVNNKGQALYKQLPPTFTLGNKANKVLELHKCPGALRFNNYL